jgi:hypothetical protein
MHSIGNIHSLHANKTQALINPIIMKNIIIILTIFLVSHYSLSAQFWKKKEGASTDSVAPKKEESKSGGGLFQKMITKVAKIAGKVGGTAFDLAKTTDDLAGVNPFTSVGTNIFPKSTGIAVTDFYNKPWIDYGDFVMLYLPAKNSPAEYFKYNGVAKCNGEELNYLGNGVYALLQNASMNSKVITLEKNNTIEGSFTIPAITSKIKIQSVNGQKDNISIDLTKDMTVDLLNYSDTKDALLRLDIVATTIGLRSLYFVAHVKPAKTITIPAAAFKHIENENPGVNFNNCYINISETNLTQTLENKGYFSTPLLATTGSNDGKFIHVTNSNKITKGLSILQTEKINGGDYVIEVSKKNASQAKPTSFAKNIAFASVTMAGTTSFYDQKTNKWTETETTKKIEFPKIPDTYIDNSLQQLRDKTADATNAVLGCKILTDDIVINAPSYQISQQYFKEERNEAGEFYKAYKNMQPIIPIGATTLAAQSFNGILTETNTDGLLKVDITVVASYDNKPVLTPTLKVELVGERNGGFRSLTGNTKYFTITIKGKPYEIKNKTQLTPEEFSKIVQVSEFTEAYKKALSELVSKEKELGEYEIIWNLQK